MQTPQPYTRTPRRARSTEAAGSPPPVWQPPRPAEPPKRPQVVVRRQRRRRIGNIMAMVLLVALVAALIMFCPKEPVRHAYYTIGTTDNAVEAAGSVAYLYQGLVISEVMTANQTAMPDEDGKYPDWVEIWNSSDQDIDLENVGLSDDPLAISFLFPKMTLKAGERIIVMCDKTNKARADEPLHAKFGLSTNGETILLYDPNAYVIDEVKTPIMSADESYALQSDGKFALTKEYSPGYENTSEGYMAYRTATMVVDGAVIINEICPDPLTGYRDADGELCDWVELYNTTGKTVDLSKYALSNNENKPLKWRFPEGAVIAPYGYYIVYCSGKDIPGEAGGVPHTNFRVSAEHDTIVLSDSHGRLVDRVTIDNIPEDASYARGEDGNFQVQERSTPQLPNTQAGKDRMDSYLQALNETEVYITEVMASNDTTETTYDAAYVDWIELYNASAEAVDLSGYGLSDNIGRARKWQFPEGTVIQPGAYLLVRCDADNAANTAAEPHTSFRLSQAGGYTVVLADPTGKILDKIVMPAVPTDVSYGRTTGREGLFYYETPTPLAQNGTGFLGYAKAPELTVAPGMHDDGISVGFTLVEGANVYYTTNGAVPTVENGILYTGQLIELNYTTVLRARAFPLNSSYRASETVTGSYFINTYHSVPVASLIVDPELLWNETNGMLVDGPNIIKDEPGGYPWKNSIYRYVKENEGPREGYFEYYVDGEQILSQGVDVKLGGDFSLDMPQKTFKLRAKAAYGEKTFAAQLFSDRPYTEYKSVNLRNAGNDGAWSRVRDGFQSRLLDAYGSIVIHQAWQPVAVYLNGEYWGHMDLRERVDRYFIAQHEGLSLEEADNMDVLVGSGSVEFGSNKEYRAMVKQIKNSNPANNAEDRAYIEANIDLENFLEYMALEMYVGNSDIGNTRFYRLHGTDPETGEPYKWKWIWYDADYGFWNSSFNSPRSYTKESGMGQQNIDNTIFRKVLEVPEWKEKFFRKLGDLFEVFTTDFMISVLEQCVEEMNEDEMEMHFYRWAEYHDKMYVSEWPTEAKAAIAYWKKHVNQLKNTLKKRPTYLWEMLQEQFKLTNAQMVDYFGEKPEMPADAVI